MAKKKSSGNKSRLTEGSQSKRQQLRSQLAAEEQRKRTNRIITVAGIVIGLVIIAIVVTVLVQNHNRNSQDTQLGSGEQLVPPNATSDNSAIGFSQNTDADVPTVTIVVDYQCPGCAFTSHTLEPMLETLADEGKVKVEYQILHGLDRYFPGNHSKRAAIGASCADFYGQFVNYTHIVFDNQPPKEGDGWTDEQLIDYASQAGIQGDDLTAWQSCFSNGQTADFVDSMQAAVPQIVTATPSFITNDQLVDVQQLKGNQPSDLYDLIMSYQ